MEWRTIIWKSVKRLFLIWLWVMLKMGNMSLYTTMMINESHFIIKLYLLFKYLEMILYSWLSIILQKALWKVSISHLYLLWEVYCLLKLKTKKTWSNLLTRVELCLMKCYLIFWRWLTKRANTTKQRRQRKRRLILVENSKKLLVKKYS